MNEREVSLENELLLFTALINAVSEHNAKAFLVGGVVRDLIIHRQLKILDYDFLVTANAGEIARTIQKEIGGQLREFPEFRTAKIIAPEKIPGLPAIDFVGARKETYASPGALPKTEEGDLSSDLARRDFTLNAMALDLKEVLKLDSGMAKLEDILSNVIDPFNGLNDIKERKIRVLHSQSFIDDPSRILRGIRYRVRFNFSYEAETEKLINHAISSGALNTIQPYRVMNEFRRFCAEPQFAEIFEEMLQSGILSALGFQMEGKSDQFLRAIKNLQLLSFAGTDIIYKTVLSLLFYCSGIQSESGFKTYNLRGDIKDSVINNIISLAAIPETLEAPQLIFNSVLDSRFPDSPYLSREVRIKISG